MREIELLTETVVVVPHVENVGRVPKPGPVGNSGSRRSLGSRRGDNTAGLAGGCRGRGNAAGRLDGGAGDDGARGGLDGRDACAGGRRATVDTEAW